MIARLSFEVKKSVEGPLTTRQTQQMAELLERYKRREKAPEVKGRVYLILKTLHPMKETYLG